MGTWGYGPFDNDTACDWASRLETAGLSLIEESFDKVLNCGSKRLFEKKSEEAIAACAVLARVKMNKTTNSFYPEEVERWIAENSLVGSSDLVKKAIAVIDRILCRPSAILNSWRTEFDYQCWSLKVRNFQLILKMSLKKT